MNVFNLPPRETLAEKLERARKLSNVQFHVPAQGPLDPETWARRKMDDALAIYREILGAAALQTRLQRALEDTQHPAGAEKCD
jgi:hypothetical protein